MVVDDKVVYIAIALVVVYNVVVLHDHLAWVDLLKNGGLGLFIGVAIPQRLLLQVKGVGWEKEIFPWCFNGSIFRFPNIIASCLCLG